MSRIIDKATRDERGFTLVELMISLLLFSFAVAGVLSAWGQTSRNKNSLRSNCAMS